MVSEGRARRERRHGAKDQRIDTLSADRLQLPPNAPTRAGEADTYPGLLRGILLAQARADVSLHGAAWLIPPTLPRFRPAPDSPAGGAQGGRIGTLRSAQDAL
jgi:hypothetical protein